MSSDARLRRWASALTVTVLLLGALAGAAECLSECDEHGCATPDTCTCICCGHATGLPAFAYPTGLPFDQDTEHRPDQTSPSPARLLSGVFHPPRSS